MNPAAHESRRYEWAAEHGDAASVAQCIERLQTAMIECTDRELLAVLRAGVPAVQAEVYRELEFRGWEPQHLAAYFPKNN